jgi:hypothetical protein
VEVEDLRQVQHRREWPTRMTQGLQMFLHKHLLEPVFRGQGPLLPPWPLRLMAMWPFLQRIPARMLGVGFRPEHILSASVEKP